MGEWGEMSSQELAEHLVWLEAQSSRIESERASVLCEFASRRGHRDLEYSSPAAFLIDRCRIAPARATRLVSLANSLQKMSLTGKAWAKGDLAADQVRHLQAAHSSSPGIFRAHEPMLVDTVSALGIVDTGQVLRYWQETADHPRAEELAESLHRQRRLHLSETFEGMWRLDGYLDPLAGELVRTALEAATPPPAPDDHRTPAQRRADALTDLCRQALDTGQLPAQGGEKPHLLVLVGAERLHGQTYGLAESATGTMFPQSSIDLLSCDCSLSRIVFGPNSEIIEVGRKTRIIPPALRRAVIARDRHCRHPGCRRPAKWCDLDHKVPWSQGGTTTLDNLQLLCRYHHRLKHFRDGRAPRLAPCAADIQGRSSVRRC